MLKQEISKSRTIHVDDEVLDRLEVIRLQVKANKIKNRQSGYVSYSEVIKRLIKFRENRNANDI
jgi:predicted CopG family antitoxin